MEILVNFGVVVEADSIKDAIAKTEPKEGTVVSLNANPRPASPPHLARQSELAAQRQQQKV